MTFGPNGPGPTDPQQPYSYGLLPVDIPPSPPPQLTNKMATWSVVFAFLFAPLGAVLGHFALADIRDYHQQGRGRAVLGLTLSYAFIVVAVGALVVWAVLPEHPATLITAAPATSTSEAPTTTTTTTATPTPRTPVVRPTGLPQLLLTIDEVKVVMNAPKLTQTMSTPPLGAPRPPSPPGGELTTNPPECVSAVLNGVDSAYTGSGALGFEQAGFADPSTGTFVGESVFALPSADSAQKFVKKMFDQWRGCAGKHVTFVTPGKPTLNWTVGNVAVTGDRITVQNVIDAGRAEPQVRIVAAKNNVIVDIDVFSRDLPPDRPEVIANQILARIPG